VAAISFSQIEDRLRIEGVGEYAATFGPRSGRQNDRGLFARRFAGRDPFQIESLWRESYGSGSVCARIFH
jgi:L-alanine-DL-glutamate epimerase-like enolase superfamily enzyme